MIRVQNIHFAYGRMPALQDISFELNPGSLCGILGANGSGKTTLLKCLLGILPAQKGSVQIGGKTLNLLSPGKRARHVAYVPQDTKQFGASTVFETVLLGRKPYFGTSPTRHDVEMASEILSSLELDNLAMRSVQTLSSGQRQRVCIAKALCQQAPVLLLDEPTANLDIRYQVEVMRLLQALSRQGKTILFSVHDMAIPRAFCTDILLLKEGKLVARGGKEVLNKTNIEFLYDVCYEDISPLLPSPEQQWQGCPERDHERIFAKCKNILNSN